jgi:hypothetical protein
MTHPSKTDPVEVTQEARDILADYYAIPGCGEWENSVAEQIRSGQLETPLVRMFAKCIASTEALRAENERLREALEGVVRILDRIAEDEGLNPLEWQVLEEARQALEEPK